MGIPFAESENQSAKRLVGLGLVLFLHLVIAYILVTSLTTEFTKPVEKPVELQIIQDIEPPPPPPKPEEKPDPKEDLNKDEAEKILKAMDNKEKDLHKGKKQQGDPRSPAKDW